MIIICIRDEFSGNVRTSSLQSGLLSLAHHPVGLRLAFTKRRLQVILSKCHELDLYFSPAMLAMTELCAPVTGLSR
jgi:hypothetical protein